MAAQVDFNFRREPVQIEVVVVVGDEERRFREIIFRGNVLQGGVIQSLGQRANAGGISLEQSVGKRVDFEVRNFHWISGGGPVKFSWPQFQAAPCEREPGRRCRVDAGRDNAPRSPR